MSLELCVWKETLELNREGEGTSFDYDNIGVDHPAYVCKTFCDGYGNLPRDLSCQSYKDMYLDNNGLKTW